MIGAALLFLTAAAIDVHAESNAVSQLGFSIEDVSSNLVCITCESGDFSTTGCGFIATMDGKVYLFTSQHLILGAEKISFKSPTGRAISPRSVELSSTRDIARLVLAGGDGLALLPVPTMGEAIGVFSSANKEQPTARYGTVTGLGADIVEVSADFTEDHSGSPVLNCDRQVIGIASYVRESRKSAMKKGTKFENRTRRFCYRIDQADFKPVNWKRFNKQYGSVYLEGSTLIDDVVKIVNGWADEPFHQVNFEIAPERSLSNWADEHNQVVRQYRKSDHYNRKFFSEYAHSTHALAEVCRSRASKIRMVAEQRGLSEFLIQQYESQAGTLEYAAKIIDQYSTSAY